MEYKNPRWQRRGNMKHGKSFKLLLSIAFTLMLVCSSWAQSTAVRRIGVLTPGGDFAPVLEGLRQGLAQLGYLEGKQITLIVEDTKMETLDPVKAAMRLIGVSNSLSILSGKRIEILKELVPGMKRVLAIVTVNELVAQKSFPFLVEAAQKLGLQLIRRDVTSKEELEKVIVDTPKGSIDAIIHVPSILQRNNIDLIVDKAKKDRLPFGVHAEELVRKGA